MPDIYEQIYSQVDKINDKTKKEILTAYADVYSAVAKNLQKNLDYRNNPMFSKVSQYVMDKYVANSFAGLVQDLKKVVPQGIETATSLAYAEALLSKRIRDDIRNINLDDLLKDVPRTLKNGQIVTQLKQVTMQDLLQATHNTEYSVKKLIRETFTKHLTIDSLKKQGNKVMADKLIQELSGSKLKETIRMGMTGIVDKAGRRWNVDTYVNMAVRTKYHQCHVAGVKQFVEDYDGHGDLARIPVKQKTKDACKYFEGMLISMTGLTEGYRTYDELKATNLIFHPNCRHNPKPYWDEASVPKSTISAHKRINKKVDKIL